MATPWVRQWRASRGSQSASPEWIEACGAVRALRAMPSAQPRARAEWEALITLTRIRKVCFCFKKNTPLGSDGPDFVRVASLPDEALEALRQLLIQMSLLRVPPYHVLLVLLSALPKKLGGVRWIGILPGIYRIWGACLYPLMQAWYLLAVDASTFFDTALQASRPFRPSMAARCQ